MTPERLAKIEGFKYTPSGEAAQCFIDELTAEIRQSWAEIRRLRELALNHNPDNRPTNLTKDAREHSLPDIDG